MAASWNQISGFKVFLLAVVQFMYVMNFKENSKLYSNDRHSLDNVSYSLNLRTWNIKVIKMNQERNIHHYPSMCICV